MAIFQTYDDVHTALGRLYDDVKCNSQIASAIKASGLNIQFRYREPDAVATILAAQPPTQPGAIFDVVWGELPDLHPDVEMSMNADVAHQFWHGKVNLMAALARRQIVAKGPIPKILKLLPAVAPMYEMYPRILREIGRPDLILP